MGPPYDQIVSTLKGYFDSYGRIYPGSRDRAYHSAQAVLWIHICAMCVSGEFGERFPLPSIAHDAMSLDLDLKYLLNIYASQNTPKMVYHMYCCNAEATPVCFEWTSNALLHLSWAKHNVPDTFNQLFQFSWYRGYDSIPLNAVLNDLLAFCVFIGRPVEWELLRIQDKRYAISFLCLLLLILLFASDQFNQILSQFSQAMAQAIYTSHPLCRPLPELLERLCNSGSQNDQLTEMVYGWCSVICENHPTLHGAKNLLLLSLELGFRQINPREGEIKAKLIHTEHHQKMANIVFSSRDGEAIADLLCAWTSRSSSYTRYPQLKICAEYLIDLHYLHPFSSRLRLYIIYVIELIGYQGFEQVRVEGLIGLLNDLQVCTKDMHSSFRWVGLLLDIIQSSENIQHLSLSYWEMLAGFVVYWSNWLEDNIYNPQIMISLQDANEWDKLKCWISVVWMVWPPEGGQTTEEDLGNVMLSLLHQQPGTLQKLKEQMEQWSKEWSENEVPESFKQICKQAHDKAAQQAIL